jgi:multisubunit Na+/H+ antiporter MnhE subunit
MLHAKMPLRPGIVARRTGLRSERVKLFLANSITLISGPLTTDVAGE